MNKSKKSGLQPLHKTVPCNYTYSIGQYDRSVKDAFEKEYDVISIKIHEDYWTKGYGYDIALLKLNVPALVFPGKVWQACLPEQGKRVPIGKECHISGNFISIDTINFC